MSEMFESLSLCVCVCARMYRQGVDLRQYSKNVEAELLEVENVSIQDCILCVWFGFVVNGINVMTMMMMMMTQ